MTTTPTRNQLTRILFSFVLVLSCVLLAVGDTDSSDELAVDDTQERRELQQRLWTGCVDPRNPSTVFLIHRGSKSWICLQVGPGGNWGAKRNNALQYSRYTFNPQADEFSRFHLPNSYSYFVGRELTPKYLPNITVHVTAQESVSFIRHYYEKGTGLIFPHLTAIVDVQDGRIRGIGWDDACVFCGKQQCAENTFDFTGKSMAGAIKDPTRGCFFTKEECTALAAAGSTECDLTLYVVWTGTDDDGNVLTSVNSRFSAFHTQSVQQVFTDSLPDVPEIPSVEDLTPDLPDIEIDLPGITDSNNDQE